MDGWGVFGIIVSIITFGVLVGSPLWKLSAVIAELKTVVSEIRKQCEKDRDNNEKEHLAIWDRDDEQDKIINSHETRITVLEKREA